MINKIEKSISLSAYSCCNWVVISRCAHKHFCHYIDRSSAFSHIESKLPLLSLWSFAILYHTGSKFSRAFPRTFWRTFLETICSSVSTTLLNYTSNVTHTSSHHFLTDDLLLIPISRCISLFRMWSKNVHWSTLSASNGLWAIGRGGKGELVLVTSSICAVCLKESCASDSKNGFRKTLFSMFQWRHQNMASLYKRMFTNIAKLYLADDNSYARCFLFPYWFLNASAIRPSLEDFCSLNHINRSHNPSFPNQNAHNQQMMAISIRYRSVMTLCRRTHRQIVVNLSATF